MIAGILRHLINIPISRLVFMRGEYYRKHKNPEQAIHTYQKSIALDRNYMPAYLCVTQLLIDAKKSEEAIPYLRKILSIDEEHSGAQYLLAKLLSVSSDPIRLHEAIHFYERCQSEHSKPTQVQVKLAGVYEKLHQFKDAAAYIEEVLNSDPFNAQLNADLAELYFKSGVFPLAENYFCNAILLDPQKILFLKSLAKLRLFLGKLDEAENCFKQVKELTEELPATNTHALLLYMRADYPGVLTEVEKIISQTTDEAVKQEAIWLKATTQLATGNFEEGWEAYEVRRYIVGKLAEAEESLKVWDGTSGVDVLLYAEQGIGDEIMFASCVRDVLSVANKCYIECNPRLEKLFRSSFPDAVVNSCKVFDEMPANDLVCSHWKRTSHLIDTYKIPIGSLPRFFRNNINSFPKHKGYLNPGDERKEHWAEYLNDYSTKPKIGISWRGGLPRTGRAYRSLELEQLVSLFNGSNVDWVSLQYGDVSDQLDQLKSQHGIKVLHLPEVIKDFHDTAALICNLDLVISIQTAAVHLTGALGVPAWVMVSASPEWRYMAKGDSMPWYPSVKIYRQKELGDWGDVIHQIKLDLQARYAH